MKTGRLVIGIISIVLFVIISFQSCAAGVYNTMSDNGDVGGTAGIMVSFFMLTAGIIGIAGRKSKGASITAGGFFAVAGLLAISNAAVFADLQIWGILSLIFAAFFIISGIVQKNKL